MSAEYGKIDTDAATRPKMNFSTTFQNHYQAKPVHMATSQLQPLQGFQQGQQGFTGQPPAQHQQQRAGVGPENLYGSELNAKMESLTTAKSSFPDKNVPSQQELSGKSGWKSLPPLHARQLKPIPQMPDTRQKSFKPDQAYHQPSKNSFSSKGDSLYNSHFVNHLNNASVNNYKRAAMTPKRRSFEDDIIRQKMLSDEYVKDIYSTEYKSKFAKKLENPCEFQRKSIRPPRSYGFGHQNNQEEIPVVKQKKFVRSNNGQFYGTTSYEDNFNAISKNPDVYNRSRKSVRPRDTSDQWFKLDKSEEKRTFRNDYPGTVGKPAEICRPKVRNDKSSDERLERRVSFDTEYGKISNKLRGG